MQNLELALDASREIERILCQVCSKRVFMAEKTKQEIDELQLNRPVDVPDKFWAQRYKKKTFFFSFFFCNHSIKTKISLPLYSQILQDFFPPTLTVPTFAKQTVASSTFFTKF